MFALTTLDLGTLVPYLALVCYSFFLTMCSIYCQSFLEWIEASVAGWKEMLDVNVVALCQCTKEAVHSMRERGVDDGQIIHISR